MSVSPTLITTPTSKVFTSAGGCFWGTEQLFRKNLGDKILDAKVGYANGATTNPSYKQVCSGFTKHTEALQVSYEPSKISYEELVKFFFLIHDPTTLNSQGPDSGWQYRSAVFTHNEEQAKIAEKVLEDVQKKLYSTQKIVTVIEPITSFWNAEDYHQDYFTKNPGHAFCPTHFVRSGPKL